MAASGGPVRAEKREERTKRKRREKEPNALKVRAWGIITSPPHHPYPLFTPLALLMIIFSADANEAKNSPFSRYVSWNNFHTYSVKFRFTITGAG